MARLMARMVKSTIRCCPGFLINRDRLKKGTRSILNQIDFEQFVRQNPTENFVDRFKMFDHVISKLNGPFNYLEFGVFKGESIAYFAANAATPECRFIGFDSFEGLPEEWAHMPKGGFDVGGNLPQIDDSRVSFVKGYFNATLPTFELKNPELPLVIHLDADLYSSTLYTLIMLDHYIKPGTILLFDEFFDRDHEFRALIDYLEASMKAAEAVGEVDRYAQACVAIKERPENG